MTRDKLHQVWLESGIWRRWAFEDFVQELYRIIKKYEKKT